MTSILESMQMGSLFERVVVAFANAAVAARGYRELTQAMVGAASSKTDALERLKSVGLGYMAFALCKPEHFTVMCDAPIPERKHPESAEAAEQAFLTLLGFVISSPDSGRPAGDSHQMALLARTMVHGIAQAGHHRSTAISLQHGDSERCRVCIDQSPAICPAWGTEGLS